MLVRHERNLFSSSTGLKLYHMPETGNLTLSFNCGGHEYVQTVLNKDEVESLLEQMSQVLGIEWTKVERVENENV